MAEEWYYMQRDQRHGPIDLDALKKAAAAGTISWQTPVWRPGLARWTAAADVSELRPALVAVASTPPPLPMDSSAPKSGAGLLRNIGARISQLTDLPEIGDVPVWDILFGEMLPKAGAREIEEHFVVGTKQTTPSLSDLEKGWPHARICWRVLAGALATYLLLRMGWTEFHNPNRIPAMMVVGAFVIPLAVVIFFFEMNTPCNVSLYQAAKMVLLGGALGIIANALMSQIITGMGAGQLIPSILTGFAEETAKALALLLVLTQTRYRWQLNGLLFGAAVGAGFAGFESAGYAFKPVWQYPGVQIVELMDLIQRNITIRALFSPGGHVIWTAIVASGIWKVKGDRPFAIAMLGEGVVVRRWLTAVALHALWDFDLVVKIFGRLVSEETCAYVQCVVLSLIGWYVVFAILKQALSEVASARITEITTSHRALQVRGS